MAGGRTGTAWASVLVGLGSVVTLPLAIYTTRFSDSYDLLHAGFALPVAAALGLVALSLARRADRRSAVSLSGPRKAARLATVGRVLGVIGLCLAVAGLVALGVYGLLEYAGSRE